ncbi:MAG: molybdopterin dehydrogenase [Planctomycetota bacterium]|nr:MAG: molybdopterin dehydrogenase [Planctomycetota bacterium]REK23248.1 MAG: molybdopterin dehydrogenase [Planctomycetota bacterium]REK30831.1 MAG: molybdopterin dehydrogenase [Planctomycetota bacterium]
MTNFEYACPETEQEAVEFLSKVQGETAVLSAGTDMMSLLRNNLARPERVVDVSRISSMQGIDRTGEGVVIGALSTLEQISESPSLADFPSLRDVVDGVRAIQVQQNGTLGGDLCHLPNCWYFRSGYGLLARENGRSLPEVGDNRYHAVFGNSGPAKFVSASRFAPAIIALGGEVRIAGPNPGEEKWLALEDFYITPKTERQGVSVLKPGQILTHIRLASDPPRLTAAYEVLEMQGLDWPQAAAACSLELDGGLVRSARIVLGHVAPTPWVSEIAASALVGQPVTVQTAERAADAAISEATPLSQNEYKVQLARTSVKRCLLRATNQL